MTTVVAITFVIATVRAVASPAFNIADLSRGAPAIAGEPDAGDVPDIFLVMLDGYPRHRHAGHVEI